jgi:hypothetical protein
MDTPLKVILEKQLSSIHCDIEPQKFEYILTKEEEEAVVRNKIEQLKKGAAWRMWNKGLPTSSIEGKILETDWDSLFDKDFILQEANKRKHFLLQDNEFIKKENERQNKEFEELKIQCDANYMFNLLSKTSFYKYGKKILVTGDTSKLIKVVCFFLGNDKRFEDEFGYSFKKGLWIRGVSGLGKTYLLTCLKDNLIKPINIYSMIDITKEISNEGNFNVDYSKIVYLDDVGSEDLNVKHYGTDVNFFKNFIESYYLNSNRFDRLIVSTNNNFSEIENRYGFRVKSRIKDMFNVVDVTGKDLRG